MHSLKPRLQRRCIGTGVHSLENDSAFTKEHCPKRHVSPLFAQIHKHPLWTHTTKAMLYGTAVNGTSSD
jgi:hypothetical protein